MSWWMNFPPLLGFGDVDDMLGYWKSLFISIVNKHAPYIKIRRKNQEHCWISGETRRLMEHEQLYDKVQENYLVGRRTLAA